MSLDVVDPLPRIGPVVHAVIVAHSPGEWFEETLRSLRDQDHSNLRVTVVETSQAARDASDETLPGEGLPGEGVSSYVAECVAEVLPEASVLGVEGNPGFAAAANAALAAHETWLEPPEEERLYLLICHDDVSLAPNVVTRLLEESMTSSAEVVGPKVVDWDDPKSLQSMGYTVDRLGTPIPLVTPGEHDQGQHDESLTALAVSSACMLVRCDLFKRLGGFDASMSFHGEDTDFGRRAVIAGASVRVAPDAVVRHRGKLSERSPDLSRERMLWRHNLRSSLVCARSHEYELIPLALVMTFCEGLASLLTGHFRRFAALAVAWPWNLLGLPEVMSRRRHLAQMSSEDSSERAARLQSRNVVSLRRFLRALFAGTEETEGFLGRPGRYWAALGSGSARVSLAAWLVAIVVFIFGSRHLLTRGVPAVGEVALFGNSPADLFREWLSDWRPEGLGVEGPGPTALPILGVASAVLFGSVSLARTVLLVGLIPFGALGLWRFMGKFGSKHGQVAGLAAFLMIPLPYNALASGNWSALGVYGVLPWVLLWLSRAVAAEGDEEKRESFLSGWVAPILGLGILVGLLGAFVPLAVAGVGMLALAIALGGLLAGEARRLPKLAALTLGGAALGWALNWSSAPLSWREMVDFGGARPPSGEGRSFIELLSFDTGAVGVQGLSWGLVALGVLGLVLARGQSFVWSLRAWCLVLLSVLAALANEHGWLVGGLSSVELLMAPAAVALAVAAALSVASIDRDTRHLNRSLLTAAAWIALSIGSIPVLATTLDGRWGMPEGDYSTTLAEVEAESQEEAFRVLWVGHPDVMPLAGWPLEGDLIYATTMSGLPKVGAQWLTAPAGQAERLASAWDEAVNGGNNRLGELLAPLGVRYLMVVERLAPEPFGEVDRPVSDLVSRRLESQFDMHLLETRPGLKVFRNTITPLTHSVLLGKGTVTAEELSGETFAFPVYERPTLARAAITSPMRVYVADAADGWTLALDGRPLEDETALGWARSFDAEPPEGVVEGEEVVSELELSYLPTRGRSAQVGQMVLWIVVITSAALLALSRRRVR